MGLFWLLQLWWIVLLRLLLISRVEIGLILIIVVGAGIRVVVLVVVACSVARLLVLLQDSQTIWQLENWLLHLQVEDALVLSVHCVVGWRLDVIDSLQRELLAWAKILHLLVRDQCLLWLLALLVQDAEVVPHFVLECVERSSLDDVLK